MKELPTTKSNYWLNTIITENIDQRDQILEETNAESVMTRPAWTPMHKLNFHYGLHTDSLRKYCMAMGKNCEGPERKIKEFVINRKK